VARYRYFQLPTSSESLKPQRADSECVASLEYDIEHAEMTIHFWKRGSYVYYDVPPEAFAEFNLASKKGTYFNLYIRPYYTNYQRIF